MRAWPRVQKGEEYVIHDRNRPVARLIPLPPEDADLDAHERYLVATGQMRLPEKEWNLDEIFRIPVGRISKKRLRAIIESERGDDR